MIFYQSKGDQGRYMNLIVIKSIKGLLKGLLAAFIISFCAVIIINFPWNTFRDGEFLSLVYMGTKLLFFNYLTIRVIVELRNLKFPHKLTIRLKALEVLLYITILSWLGTDSPFKFKEFMYLFTSHTVSYFSVRLLIYLGHHIHHKLKLKNKISQVHLE
jgi:hypothetical protein